MSINFDKTYVARAVAKKKWEQVSDLGCDEIAADAFTSDLRTTNNALSFWICSSEQREINNAALALASNRSNIDKIDLVWIEKDTLEAEGIVMQSSPGNTPMQGMQDRHIDAVFLDLTRLGIVAQQVANAVRHENRFCRFTNKQVLDLLVEALKNQKINLSDLKNELKASVIKRMNR